MNHTKGCDTLFDGQEHDGCVPKNSDDNSE